MIDIVIENLFKKNDCFKRQSKARTQRRNGANDTGNYTTYNTTTAVAANVGLQTRLTTMESH